MGWVPSHTCLLIHCWPLPQRPSHGSAFVRPGLVEVDSQEAIVEEDSAERLLSGWALGSRPCWC